MTLSRRIRNLLSEFGVLGRIVEFLDGADSGECMNELKTIFDFFSNYSIFDI